MRKKQHAIDIAKIKAKKEHDGTKECNHCANILLKDIRFPMDKLNKMFMADFIHMKYNRPPNEIT